jgi:hypothetical protein
VKNIWELLTGVILLVVDVADFVLDFSGSCPYPKSYYYEDARTGYPLEIVTRCNWRYDCVCPDCSKKRRLAIHDRLMDSLPSFSELRFLTLTVRYDVGSTVADRLDQLWSFRKRLFKELLRPQWYLGRGYVWTWSPGFRIPRWAGVVELPNHLHLAADAGYIDIFLIKYLWEKLTGDSFECYYERAEGRSPYQLARYLSKYLTKNQGSIRLVDTIILKGKHFFQSYGLDRVVRMPFFVRVAGSVILGLFGWKRMSSDDFDDRVATWEREVVKHDRFISDTHPQSKLDTFCLGGVIY